MEILDRTALEAIGIQWGGARRRQCRPGHAWSARASQSPVQHPGHAADPGQRSTPAEPEPEPGSRPPARSSRTTGLPLGGNLVNLPISALPNAAGVLPAGGIAFGIIGTNWNINLALQALPTQGKTRTLARPEIVTVENNKAEISLGEEIPYATVSSAGTQIQFKEALLKLDVDPDRHPDARGRQDDTKIKLVVVVENNSRGDVVNLGRAARRPPSTSARRRPRCCSRRASASSSAA